MGQLANGLLEGRKALVTGGGSGIGRATAKRFIDEGADVVIVDINEKNGSAVADEIGATFVQADGSDPSQVADAFRQAIDALGSLDIAYMNAGITTYMRGERQPGQTFDITELTDDLYHRILGINVHGVFYGVREAVRAMQGSGGSILCTASLAGLIAYSGDPIYALTKHAVVGLVRGLGATLKEQGITINAICPGIVETPLVGAEAAQALKDAGFPLIAPEGIAEACVMAITGGRSGDCWTIQPGRTPEAYHFHGVPGPRTDGAVGMRPPARLDRQI
jgi:NAD(P)-dependent dehydrogenase (short-subunit alcohol dehydrogenase family)